MAHLDHGLRPESAAEADFVRALAEARGLPITVERAELPARVPARGWRWRRRAGLPLGLSSPASPLSEGATGQSAGGAQRAGGIRAGGTGCLICTLPLRRGKGALERALRGDLLGPSRPPFGGN